ncbi:hypothetical protein SAMN04515671_2475 [Nakamurella panacisegetis]|uniref:Uncharacterized protein n=1 Tax=Nakamurella panacisegetis TaxID=1090615 RepID=A0A1H0NSU3_9ACTN|nr:hypothetical protein SAMN04515671_2475 [Nakamurella panacisegetis]
MSIGQIGVIIFCGGDPIASGVRSLRAVSGTAEFFT